jgi:hypothetical protein
MRSRGPVSWRTNSANSSSPLARHRAAATSGFGGPQRQAKKQRRESRSPSRPSGHTRSSSPAGNLKSAAKWRTRLDDFIGKQIGKQRRSGAPRPTHANGRSSTSTGPTGPGGRLKGIDQQFAKAEKAVAGRTAVKRNRFVQLTGATKSINRTLETKARALAGLKGYVTSLQPAVPITHGWTKICPLPIGSPGCVLRPSLTWWGTSGIRAPTIQVAVDQRKHTGSDETEENSSAPRLGDQSRRPSTSRKRSVASRRVGRGYRTMHSLHCGAARGDGVTNFLLPRWRVPPLRHRQRRAACPRCPRRPAPGVPIWTVIGLDWCRGGVGSLSRPLNAFQGRFRGPP